MIIDFFSWYDQDGIPLDVIFQSSIELGFRLDWQSFWLQSIEKGWNPYSTFSKLSHEVLEVFGQEYHQEWIFRMKRLIISL